jgi:hypothetical protein
MLQTFVQTLLEVCSCWRQHCIMDC